MNSKFINLLKDKNFVVSYYLLRNYKQFGIESEEFIILIYLINVTQPIICDYKRISNELNVSQRDLMNIISKMNEKGILEIKITKNLENKLEEHILLEPLYTKIFMSTINEEEETSSIYSIFEEEFGRLLSPIEYELINSWLEKGFKEEIIIEALKEAVFNGVNNFRYIDRILFEWDKKNIKTKEDINKNKKDFKSSKEEVSIPDYDWLNEEKNN